MSNKAPSRASASLLVWDATATPRSRARSHSIPAPTAVKPAFSDFERTAAAHEIRGALSVLSLYIELLRVSADAGEVPDPSWIDTMSSSVRRAATITTRLAMRTPPPSRDVAGRR